jgi:hypothetical protein
MNQHIPIRKLLMFLALAGVGAAAIVIETTAKALPPTTLTQIVCNGRSCGGTGPRQYRYEITPGTATPPITSVDIGWHHPLTPITSIISPGWTPTVVSLTSVDSFPMTPHGGASSPTGNCLFVLRWSGAPQSAPFVIAFNCDQPPHDVTWSESNGTTSNWLRPVGNGQGPVHSPIPID